MISAIILAAGRSRRMGQPKMLLPWRNTSVLAHVINTVQHAGVLDVLVVTGSQRETVEEIAVQHKARTTYNEKFETHEMLGSIQCGLQKLPTGVEAALICLGDQPQIQEETVRAVCQTFVEHRHLLVVPSYQMRRGHPWLVARPLWDELLGLGPHESSRDFLQRHHEDIKYVELNSSSIIEDLDTPDDYLKFKPSV